MRTRGPFRPDDGEDGVDVARPDQEHLHGTVQILPVQLDTTAAPPADPETVDRALSTRELAWRRFKRHKLAIAAGVVLALLVASAIAAPLIAPYSFHAIDLANPVAPPGWRHWFGTDGLGRDQLTRVLYGGRVSLLVGVTVALAAGVIGTIVGALAGYYGRWVDNLLMRVTDLMLSLPGLVVLIVASRILGGSTWEIIVILSALFWMGDARIVRGLFLSLKEKEYVEAARASGGSNSRIIFLHILPNALGPIVVNTTLDVADAILTESALSFLGFGIQPPTPSWGNMLEGAQNFTLTAPWLVWFPGLAILVTVLAVNFLGDGLRDALDPHQRIAAAP